MNTIFALFGINHISEHGLVKERLAEGRDVNLRDSGGRTLLMQAVIEKDDILVKILIRNNADVNIRDHRGWTALHFAAEFDNRFASQILLDSGADVHARDAFGVNVIARAVFAVREGLDLIRELLDHGAVPSIKNNIGISALDLAISLSNDELINLLNYDPVNTALGLGEES